MSTIGKPIRLVNPGKRKRLTLLQKLHFGSARQRAAAKMKLKNPRKRHNPGSDPKRIRKALKKKDYKRASYYAGHAEARYQQRKARIKDRSSWASTWNKAEGSKRLPNVGEIITIRPLKNSGTKRKKGKSKFNNPMAKRHHKSNKRRLAGLKAARTRKRRLSARRHTSNPGVRRRTRRHFNNGHRRRTYRRRRYSNLGFAMTRKRSYRRSRRSRGYSNPGFLTGDFGAALQIIAGAFVTKLATNFLPAAVSTGIPGYIATALIAMLQGKAIGKLLKNPRLGNNMAIGGYVYLALRIASDYLPSLGLPFSLNGLGQQYGSSSFFTPQVPMNGSMATFVTPGASRMAIAAAIPSTASGMRGLGTVRRVGRMR